MIRTLALLTCLLALAGCQSSRPLPEDSASESVRLSAQHCLSEYLKDLEKLHYGPCLKITEVDGRPAKAGPDGFIELPLATPMVLTTSCVYRHADGSPVPATMEISEFRVATTTFSQPGQRWYLHAHEQARGVIGCQPTLSRSTYPTYQSN